MHSAHGQPRSTARNSAQTGARALVIGLDGADLGVIRTLGAGRLPTLHRLMERGAFAALESVQPPATLPNWSTFLTGEDPGVHGVFDFTTRVGYGVRFTAGRVREAPTIFAALDRRGLACACLFFPATYPPEKLSRGVFVSGWDAPVAFSADSRFVSPSRLHDELRSRFGPQTFDDVDEFHADAPGFHAALPAALEKRIERRVEIGRYLLQKQRWDVLAIYFGETDTAAHHLWSLWDERSSRHVAGLPSDGLSRVYEAADRAVGELLGAAGGDEVELTVVSDHGSGGSSNKVLYLNRVLEHAGLLRFKHGRAGELAGVLKQLALRALPPRAREQAFRAAGTLLPSWLESHARYGAIDFRHSLVFSDELNYFPAIHYNLRGREPQGQLDPRDVPALRERLERELLALRDPWTSERIVTAVHAREELFTGPHVSRAPDLVLELALDRGYSYNLMPSNEAPPGVLLRKLVPHEHLGRKGRSLPGSHRPRGFYLEAGPRIAQQGEIELAMREATARVLARVPEPVRAQVEARAPAPQMPQAPSPAERTHEGERRVAERLRALGYIE